MYKRKRSPSAAKGRRSTTHIMVDIASPDSHSPYAKDVRESSDSTLLTSITGSLRSLSTSLDILDTDEHQSIESGPSSFGRPSHLLVDPISFGLATPASLPESPIVERSVCAQQRSLSCF